MSDENKDNVVENEEVNVDDLEPNADPKGGMARVQLGNKSKLAGVKKVLSVPDFKKDPKTSL